MIIDNIRFWALTTEFLGKFMIILSALRVHHKVKKEHKIDKKVLKALNRERDLAIIGIVLLIIGYFLHLIALK